MSKAEILERIDDIASALAAANAVEEAAYLRGTIDALLGEDPNPGHMLGDGEADDEPAMAYRHAYTAVNACEVV